MATEKLSPKHPDWVWLQTPYDQLIQERSAPYDAKVDKWVADNDEVFIKAALKKVDGDKCTLETCKGTEITLPKAEVLDCNPSKFEKEEDMSNLSILNKACILHNLRTRYNVLQIYTYSGLFCICINPYKWLMVYTQIMRDHYRNKRRNEAPPHLYAIADGALQLMEMEHKHQSSLITGESGAGKTENTKKVLQYYALNCADPKAAKSKASQSENAGSLEEQIIQANPPLEAYGNAKTVRNNNSSRFGKFIRIHFGPTNKIASADIETYLLEKSRITFQLEIERNYHIFYQFMSGFNTKYHDMALLGQNPNPGDYFFIAQGVLTVAGMDDKEEMQLTDEAFDTLGFSQDDKNGLYTATIAICYLGNSKWKQKGREEQAEPDGMDMCNKAAALFGVDADFFVDTFMKPKLKVGKDFVKKGQNKDQVAFAISATSKSLYARLFDWVVGLVNDSLDTPNPRRQFIGVLDIAGFEIFELNTLEQLLINYTNERLQQFFNHHMFVEEQEEYKREGIQWDFIDFGMDLLATIELIEKKMGILAMLEEECIVPKATDKSFLEKLMGKHLGKNPKFGKPKPAKKGKPEAHFELGHYAGVVGYNVTGWLFKNKDPVNEAVVNMMQEAGNAVVNLVFQEKDTGEKKKGSALMTISAGHRESLSKLMNNLQSTHPHFVRCIIPNELKKSGYTDAPLVMHQLTCNGVLEGVRICQLGLPNKVMYPDFMVRYSICQPKIFADMAADPKACAQKALIESGMDPENFRTGHTKVMFRAGKLAELEEIREAALTTIIGKMQCHARVAIMKLETYNSRKAEKNAFACIQRNIRLYYACKDWVWFKFYTMVKAESTKIIAKQKEEERKKLMEAGLELCQGKVDAAVAEREAEEAVNVEKAQTKSALGAEIEAMGTVAMDDVEAIQEGEAACEAMTKKFNSLRLATQKEIAELKAEVAKTVAELTAIKKETEMELSDMKAKHDGLVGDCQKTRASAVSREALMPEGKLEISKMEDEITKCVRAGTQLRREKKEAMAAIGKNGQMKWLHGRLAEMLDLA